MSPGFAEKHWYRLSAVSLLLLPIGLAFSLLVRLRRLLYRAGILGSVRLPVPVIVVGNLTVGGTGKTPVVLWLAQELGRLGRHPGILCRGYGGTEHGPLEVRRADDPARVGDEPALLALRSGCPVWIGRDRAAAGAALLRAHPDCDIIVCDDGLQHYRLARDLEIAVEDERGHGNGLMLPAGPLREPSSRQVDALVVNGPAPAPEVRTAKQAFGMRLEPRGYHFVEDPDRAVSVADLSSKRLHAVAGIGNPARFFSLLKAQGINAVSHAYPDHHAYSQSDLDFPECDAVLMTEKDAVKCRRFGRAGTDLIALRVDAVLDPAFPDFLRQRLHGRASA